MFIYSIRNEYEFQTEHYGKYRAEQARTKEASKQQQSRVEEMNKIFSFILIISRIYNEKHKKTSGDIKNKSCKITKW